MIHANTRNTNQQAALKHNMDGIEKPMRSGETRQPLATLDQLQSASLALPSTLTPSHDLHASINTTRSAVDSSAASSHASHSFLDSSMECTESLDDSPLGAHYPELASRSLALASQVALDRIHIQSLESQLNAAHIWNTSLEEEKDRLRADRDEWRATAEARESALRQTQIMLACVQEPLQHTSTSPSNADSYGPISPRSAAFDRERQALSSHHRAALDAKDALIASLVAERERSELALRAARSDLSEYIRNSAAARYADAQLAHDQREKLQRLVESQLEQQRRITEFAVNEAEEKVKKHIEQTQTHTTSGGNTVP